MNALPIQAIKKASQIRTRLKLDIFEPINIFDACDALEVSVRFIGVSMEGMYVSVADASSPVILLSSLRPLPRRIFTCAHELGHHVFKHGSKVDGLTDHNAEAARYDAEEYLVDIFAGALLMPVAGVEREFRKRRWEPHNSNPAQFYIIASVFGTGYSTMIKHCKANKLINETKAAELLRQSPAKLLRGFVGSMHEISYFKIVDNHTILNTIDLEVGNYLFLPSEVNLEGDHLCKLKSTEIGDMFIAKRPGIGRAVSSANGSGSFIRVQNTGYIGLAENRHLEDNVEWL